MKPSVIKQLRASAHRNKLKPVVMIGMKGLTEAVIDEMEMALNHHELIKIKVPALEKQDKLKLVDEICDATQAEKIQLIGNTLVLYKLNKETDRYKKERQE